MTEIVTTTDEVNRGETYKALNALLFKALTDLKHRHLNCWCQHGVGNPMYPHHTHACELAQIVYAKAGGK